MIEVIALAGALANPGEDRIAAMRLRDIIDQFHDQNRLADAGTAEEANLAALGVRRQKIDDLDASDEDLRFRRLFRIARCRLVNGTAGARSDRPQFIDRLADDIDDTAEAFLTDRHRNRR